MSDIGFYSNHRLTLRLELVNTPGVFANVANLLASKKASLGAVDIVKATPQKMVRDITFDVADETQGYQVVAGLQKLKNVKIISASDPTFLLHLGGKIRVQSKVPLETRNQLSMAYTPGVAKVSQAIAIAPWKAYTLTIKSNSVAVVSDGSAILGLGNLGPAAALPVMEGKAMIFREFAGIDAWPLCLDTQNVDEIVKTVKHISPAFGAINLEDISAPRCFEIEERLKNELEIPVMHDDQHGTAVVILAALKNALKIVKKDIRNIKVVVIGLGAAGIACCRILLSAGVKHLVGCDRPGVVLTVGARNLRQARTNIFQFIDHKHPQMSLQQALAGAHVLVGVSGGNILSARDIRKMAPNPIVFAMANPDPEIDPVVAPKVCRIFATGRSDYPNQINNALAFPGIFRGALDARAGTINEPMKLAAAHAIASLVEKGQLNEDYIVPSIFDKRVVRAVAAAVAKAAVLSGVAKKGASKEAAG